MNQIYLLSIFSLFCLSNANIFAQQNSLKTDDVRISWDYTSMEKMADKGGYPRLLRLQDSSIIIIYETHTGSIEYKRSYDNGESWEYPVQVFSQFIYSNLLGESTIVNMANAEIKQLQNGDLIAGCNYRPAKAEIAPYSIIVRRSKDNGKTWLPPQVLYNAAPRFKDGCWEPSFLQLPNGELQVYFANENPYQESDEQEISMLSSTDNGETWAKATKTVSFRKGRRDGMPVSIICADEIVTVIEDNCKEAFKPYTVRTKLTDNWAEPVLGNSEMRDYSLQTPVSDSVYMGAPYIISLSNEQTLISYQTTEDRSPNWELSTMEVAIGDEEARNFKYRTRPFPVPLDKEAKWNSLAIWNQDTVVAVASSNFDKKGVAPWIIKGYLIPSRFRISKSTEQSQSLFIGSKGTTNANVILQEDSDNLYIIAKVIDSSKSPLDGLSVCFASDKDRYKIFSNREGIISVWKEKKGEWKPFSMQKVQVDSEIDKNGYTLTFFISKTEIPLLSKDSYYFNAILSAYESEAPGYEEAIVNSCIQDIDTWLKVKTN